MFSVTAELSPEDKEQIKSQVEQLVAAVNTGNAETMAGILSPQARAKLAEEFRTFLEEENHQLQQKVESFRELPDGKVKVKGSYSLSGSDWKVNGISASYVFEQQGNSWLLVDTTIHQKADPFYFLRLVGKVLAIALPLIIIINIFWIWMLVDAAQREFEHKVLWILLLIFTGIIGAGLYFFLIRRKMKQQQKRR